jgi:hypothetical protein
MVFLTFDLNGLYGRTHYHLSAVGSSLLGREPAVESIARFRNRVVRIPSAPPAAFHLDLGVDLDLICIADFA